MSIQRFVVGADYLIPFEQAKGVWESPAEVILYSDHVKSINMAAMKAYQYLVLTGNKDAAEKISQIILESGR